jgi:hypothetical protein
MPARKKTVGKPIEKPVVAEDLHARRTLRTTMNMLIGARIPFKVHYPTKGSMVITLEGGLTHDQLRVAVDHGASIGPNAQVMILVPKLSNDA